jgi:hypothetical protein
MGRTIALKLSQKEEQIVTQLNKQGMTNSELLRNALRQYFEYLHQTTALNTLEKTMLFTQDNENIMTGDSINNLKKEVEEVRSLTVKTREELQNEITKLQQTTSELYIDTTVIQQKSLPSRTDVTKDVHREVDVFLERQMKHTDMVKKIF